ncbi:DUF488 family protein [Flavobacteriaceae bacterium Ap0902]|nr:DUF488 family protein [Flavobacteriaceae bacterium Ap0902]
MTYKTNQTIYTIGHSNLPIEKFTEMLEVFGIDTLIDVRSMPGSRKYPQFNQDILKKSLAKIGITYYHFKSLGGRRKVQKESINTLWRNKSFQAYADYMHADEFAKGLDELKELATHHTCAIMCAEAVWWRCHRSMISDVLKVQDWEVLHIMGANKVTEHPYTSPARIVNGKVSYSEEE